MTITQEGRTDWRSAARADKAAEREQDRADRADRAKARLDREQLRAQAELERQRLEAELARADRAEQTEQDRRAEEDRRRREAADRRQREQEKQHRQEAKAARSAKRRAWLAANAALPFVGLVMACSVVPAVVSQVGALTGAHVPVALAVLLAVMLEGATWAVTFMGTAAERQGRPVRQYRVGTWLFAALAAVINLAHGWEHYPDARWVALVLAASSLVAVAIWDLHQHHGKAPSKQQKKERADREAHAKARRKIHKDVVELADSILAAAHFGTVTADVAFERAWVAIHGTTALGVTPEIRTRAVKAATAFDAAHFVEPEPASVGIRARLLDSLYSPEGGLPTLGDCSPLSAHRSEKAQVAAQMPPASGKGAERSRPVPPKRRKGDSPRYHAAARVAARQTALAVVGGER